MAGRRRYSEDDRANALAALAANGGNLERTAEELGIPRTTMQRWVNGTAHPEAAAHAAGKKEDLAAKLEDVANRLANAMSDKIKKAGLKDTAISMGIAIEKSRLLRDKPTSISQDATEPDLSCLTDEELEQYDRIHRKLAGLPSTGDTSSGTTEVPPQPAEVH